MIKGSKYLLLKNKEHLLPEEALRLQRLLELNHNLSLTYILKDMLKKLGDEIDQLKLRKPWMNGVEWLKRVI